jgi:hypothetical protein
LLITASVVPSSPILVTLMKEELRSSETSVHTRDTPRNISEDATLHSHGRENLKSYINMKNFEYHGIWAVGIIAKGQINKQKQTPWPLARKRTIPTERPPLNNRKSYTLVGKGVT